MATASSKKLLAPIIEERCIIGGPSIAYAFVDSLAFYAYLIETTGDSLRTKFHAVDRRENGHPFILSPRIRLLQTAVRFILSCRAVSRDRGLCRYAEKDEWNGGNASSLTDNIVKLSLVVGYP